MENYDLARYCTNILSPIFRMMGWTWGKQIPPTYNEIADELESLIDECKVGNSIATGRLKVEKYKNEEGEVEVKVYLEIGQTVS